MKRDSAEIGQILQQRFAGNLLYMPIHQALDSLTRDAQAPRPAALVFADIQPDVSTMAPRSVKRLHSGFHLQGLLHHAPDPRKG